LTAKRNEQAASGNDARIRVAVNSVVVPVVVRDAEGRAVEGMRQEDFQILDNNKTHAISGFSVQRRVYIASNVGGSNAAPMSPGMTLLPTTVPRRFIVFLFDDMHLEPGELLQVQKVATKMIGGALSDSDMALVISFSGASSGLTRDHGKLLDTIASLKMQTLYRHAGRECPDVSYYQGNLIVNQHNAQAFETAVDDAITCAHLKDGRSVAEAMASQTARRAVEIGDQDVHITLGFMKNLVRKMGTLPGERTVVLISPGFLTVSPEAMAEESQVLDAAAESNVTISAMDARGLYSTELGASQLGSNSLRDLITSDTAQNYSSAMTSSEDIMSSLADGTGGTYFHNSNDLEGGFQRLGAAPEYVYLLEISLENVKQDGTYHRLKVKPDKEGLKVQSRRGYFAPRREKDKK
jgi:VWFA-related protein